MPGLLADLSRENTHHEVVVVDGGSTDCTVSLAVRSGARVLHTGTGRGLQFRTGAEAARGKYLLILHADSRFPPGGLAAIESRLATTPEITGGNFRLEFDGGTGFDRWLTGFYTALRARGIYYGDSGVFVRRTTYETLGGIPPLALMEDLAFARQQENLGETICIEQPPLMTSSRRFTGRAPWRIVAGWLWIHALYYLGASSQFLAWLYDSKRRRTIGSGPSHSHGR